ncbi:MAG: glycosyltransferase [Anaerolineae bacterium]
MRASVIVPAHNATATIGECLEALRRQSLPGADYEIIVVDDGSSDSTRESVAEYGAKLLTQDHQGPAVARNLGAAQAQGEIILFTDADCVPASDWIETLLTAFSDDQIAGAKGIYRTHQKELVARFVQLEYEDKYDLMRKERYIDFIDTYSAAYRKEVFNNNEGFDPAFPRASGEDVEFSYRLAERGYKMVFVPQAIVYHRHVDSLWDYLKRKFYVGYWRVLMYRKHPGKIWKDSHTPQLLKVQVGLALLLFALCPLVLLRREFLLAPAITTLLFLATALPFTVKGWPKDRAVSLLSPALLFLRACALGFGFLAGLLGCLLGKGAPR